MTTVSVVIPVYNSERILPQLIERLSAVLSSLADAYEVIMVEDGGSDHSWQVIEDLARRHEWVRGIQLMRNYGQHNALLCGIRSAQYEIVVTMDDDLQHPPEEIPNLIEKLREGYDVVYGYPEREQHGLFRVMASQVTKIALQNAMGAEAARRISAFRAFRAHLRQAFADYRAPFANLDVLLTWGTGRFVAVTTRHDPRAHGRSNYTLYKLAAHTFNMLTGFSTLPLQFASLIGFLLALFGAVLLAYVILVRVVILGYDVPGFTFTASIIIIFSGGQLFALGIIGEYLSRIHFRTMDRPAYVIRETTEEPVHASLENPELR